MFKSGGFRTFLMAGGEETTLQCRGGGFVPWSGSKDPISCGEDPVQPNEKVNKKW